MAIQCDTLRRDPLEGYPSGRRRAVNRGLVPLLHPAPGFLLWGGYASMRSSISPPASSVLLCRYGFRLALISRPRPCMMSWSCSRSFRAETFSLMSLHMDSDIQPFFLASLYFVLGISLRRAAKIPSSLIGLVGGHIWRRMLLPRYLVCSLMGAIRRQPRTIKNLL